MGYLSARTVITLVSGLLLAGQGCGGKARADKFGNTPGDGGGDGEPSRGGSRSGGTAGQGGESGSVSSRAGAAGISHAGAANSLGGQAGSTSSSGGAGGTGPTGGSAGAPAVGGPELELVAPVATTDPAGGAVLTSGSVEVRCMAREAADAGSSPVAASSVKLALLNAEGAVVQELAGAATDTPDEYVATFVTASLPSAPVSFRCVASDSSTPARQSVTVIQSFVDNGPAVEILAPAADEVLPLLGATHIEFTVNPALLDSNDTQAALADLTLTLAGVNIPSCEVASAPCFAPKAGSPGVYVTDIDFTDTLVFSPTPTLVSAIVSATNQRSPAPATRTVEQQFSLDGVGPVITITSPSTTAAVGGEIIVEFTVSDAAGVDPTSIAVEIDGTRYLYPTEGAWAYSGGKYRFRFDTSNIVLLSQLSVRVLARDTVQNDAPGGGRSILVPIDNVSPIVDLDPGNVRELAWKNEALGTTQCTVSFDPLGSGSGVSPPNDGDVVTGQYGRIFRALVWDRTNGSAGDPSMTYADIERSSVRLYARLAAAAATDPLVFDSNGDDVCDEVDITAPAFVELAAVTPDNWGYYPPASAFDPEVIPLPEGCTDYGTAAGPRANLCTPSNPDLYHVIRHCHSGTEPVVYGIPALSGPDCTGQAWLLTNDTRLGEGWICLAARAIDKVGNIGVSAPLRVCFDAPGGTTPDCSPQAMPTCTDGCSAPPRFEPQMIDRR